MTALFPRREGAPHAQARRRRTAGNQAGDGRRAERPAGALAVRSMYGERTRTIASFVRKGRPQRGESPAEAATRETREETGVSATLLEALPGRFPGTTTHSSYFLLAPVAELGAWDGETSAIRWATCEEAARLIANTPNGIGRALIRF